ncbi:hypothetical protein B0T14DRAFT_269732 [Immersiella caudata]|uniref:Uncharacterized protein n=1 Tax=Immersiella caudata TaxID=314043 RepID=A0AA39WLD8_9PEZI|nr:hypothetical protein B0T14DRAFT_269732 [Immersiella caudata]
MKGQDRRIENGLGLELRGRITDRAGSPRSYRDRIRQVSRWRERDRDPGGPKQPMLRLCLRAPTVFRGLNGRFRNLEALDVAVLPISRSWKSGSLRCLQCLLRTPRLPSVGRTMRSERHQPCQGGVGLLKERQSSAREGKHGPGAGAVASDWTHPSPQVINVSMLGPTSARNRAYLSRDRYLGCCKIFRRPASQPSTPAREIKPQVLLFLRGDRRFSCIFPGVGMSSWGGCARVQNYHEYSPFLSTLCGWPANRILNGKRDTVASRVYVTLERYAGLKFGLLKEPSDVGGFAVRLRSCCAMFPELGSAETGFGLPNQPFLLLNQARSCGQGHRTRPLSRRGTRSVHEG